MSETYKVTGAIKLIKETETFPSGFCKRGVVVTAGDDKYPQDLLIEFFKDKGDLLDSFKPGDEVEVNINIQGREYNDRYFVSLQGWAIKRIGAEQDPGPASYENEHGEDMTVGDDELNF